LDRLVGLVKERQTAIWTNASMTFAALMCEKDARYKNDLISLYTSTEGVEWLNFDQSGVCLYLAHT